MRGLALAGFGLGIVALGCQPQAEPVEKPPAPDMSEVISAYDAPTAPLDQAAADSLWAAVHDAVDLLNEVGIDDTMLDAIQKAIDEQLNGTSTTAADGQTGTARQPLIEGDGYLRVTRICNGWGPEPMPDKDANGFIDLTAGFSEGGFDSVIWGGFHTCKYLVAGQQIELRGPNDTDVGMFSGYIGDNVPFDQTGLAPTLYRFDVTAVVGDQTYVVATDFGLDPSTLTFRVRVPVGGGYLIAEAGSELLGVHATNGDFSCSEATRSCTNGSETVTF